MGNPNYRSHNRAMLWKIQAAKASQMSACWHKKFPIGWCPYITTRGTCNYIEQFQRSGLESKPWTTAFRSISRTYSL